MTQETALTIGVDAGPLLGRGGISGYVAPLVRALVGLDPHQRYRLVLRRSWASGEAVRALSQLAPTSTTRVPDAWLNWWWDHVGTVFPAGRRVWDGLDCFLATCLMAPVLPGGKVAAIVYDLIPLKLPALFPNHHAFRTAIGRLLDRSALLIAISARTKQDLIELFGVDDARIRVVYPGRNPEFRPQEAPRIAAITARHRLTNPYLLYVGAHGPHKNVPTMVRAYEQARRRGDLKADLVLVIRAGLEEARALVERTTVKASVHCLGEVPGEDLPPLFAGAECTLVPSRYEGFGLPVLEAMACGSPVIASNAGALPEVAGGAAYEVDPDDVDGWAQAMCRMAGEQQLRAGGRQKGLERAARFSWEASASRLLAALTALSGRVGHA